MKFTYNRHIAFSNNPYYVDIEATASDLTNDNGLKRALMTVMVDGESVGDIYVYFIDNKATVDLSDWGKLYAHKIVTWDDASLGFCTTNDIAKIKIDGMQNSIMFLRGGISRAAIRKSGNWAQAMDARLLKTSGNMLAVTRCIGDDIYIYRSEAKNMLLPFFIGESVYNVKIKSEDGDVISTHTGATDTICAIDIDSIIELYPTDKIFTVMRGDAEACRIHVIDDPMSDERYMLRFVNSYGFFDNILLTGKGYDGFELSNTTAYQQYDAAVGDYTQQSTDQKLRNTLEVNTGYLSKWRAKLVRDLILSPEAYILLDDTYTRCKVTPQGDVTIQRIAEEPESLTLSITLDDEINPD